jgi:REP element-mobilizing transposase RayT
MARPLRIEYPGAVYHVLSRGVGRRDIFHADRDYHTFLLKLAENASDFRVKVRSYCLMKNHFHLYVQTQEANLSKFMQSLLTSFAVIKNRRDRRTGHLFQGRFKGHLIEEDGYGNVLSRYIHLNPVRVKKVKSLPVDERQKLLREYPWSSYAAVIGQRECPDWLDRDAALLTWGETLKEKHKNYMEYVEQGLLREVDSPFEAAAAQFIIGSEDFIEKIRRLYLQVSDKVNIRRDQTQAMKLRSWVAVDEMERLIAKFYDCTVESLRVRYQHGNEARLMLQYLMAKYCRGRYALVELSERLGISVGGLTSARFRMKRRLSDEPKLRQHLAALEKQLNNQKTIK